MWFPAFSWRFWKAKSTSTTWRLFLRAYNREYETFQTVSQDKGIGMAMLAGLRNVASASQAVALGPSLSTPSTKTRQTSTNGRASGNQSRPAEINLAHSRHYRIRRLGDDAWNKR
jgi:hypothetical protein